MSIVTTPITNSDSFAAWLASFNQLLLYVNNNIVTVNTTVGTTIGNGFITGIFGSNTITATTIRGGNVTTNSALSIISNTTFGNTVTITANLAVDGSVLFVDTVTNRVGINNNTPTAALTVGGDFVVSGNVGAAYGVFNNDVSAANVFANNVSVLANVNANNIIANSFTVNLNLSANNLTATQNVTGNVVTAGVRLNSPILIGLANNLGSANLATFGAGSFGGLIGWNRSVGDGDISVLAIKGAGSFGGFSVHNWNNTSTNSTSLVFKTDLSKTYIPSGNVGIGNSANPNAKLWVGGTCNVDSSFITMGGALVVNGSSGYVGLNRAAPVARLHVYDAFNGSVQVLFENESTGGSAFQQIQQRQGANHYWLQNLYAAGGFMIESCGASIGAHYVDVNVHYFRTGAGTEIINISGSGIYQATGGYTINSGNLSVGGAVTSSTLSTSAWINCGQGISCGTQAVFNGGASGAWFSATGDIAAGGNIYTTSDIKIKENILTIEEPLKKIKKLRGVRYTHKESKKNKFGVIAQETKKVTPELVGKNKLNNLLEVDYNGFAPILIEAVKELNNIVEIQSKEIKALKKQIAKLEKKKV